MARPEGMLEVGHIRRAHGLHGDVFVQLSADRSERLDPGAKLWTERRELVVVSTRSTSNGRRIVSFEGIADRTEAERWANVALFAPPLDDADTLWVHELIGRHVVDQHGVDRGICASILANPAADIIELDSGFLVPTNFVVALDDDTIRVDVPDGLFDDE